MRRFWASLPERRAKFSAWFRVQFFRMWTAATVVVLFGVAFWYAPEFLTWWQKHVLLMINNGSALLPYPWSSRLEFVMVSLGASIWLQITLAIIAFRVCLWPVILWMRRRRMRRANQHSAETRLAQWQEHVRHRSEAAL